MSAPRLSIMPGWVFTDDRFKPMDIKILGMLGRHIDKGGWCTRSQVKLAKEMGIARSTVQASLTRLCDIGVVQKRQNQTDDGRDCSHDWRVLLDVEPEALKPRKPVPDEAEDKLENDDDTPCRYTGTPAAISAPPADPMDRHPLPTHGPAPYKNDPLKTTPQKRERESASADAPDRVEVDEVEGAEAGGEVPEKADPATVPETADFQKRVMRFCNGRDFAAGPWPDWDTSSPGWIGRQFAKLSEADRQHAERWRDAYLRDIATRRKKPVPVGTFFRDRLWEGLDPELLQRAMKAAQQGAKPAEHAKPEGWAVSMGPVWAVCLAEVLISGPEHGEHVPSNGVWLRMNLTKAWPKLVQLCDLARAKRGLVLPERYHRMKHLVEFVPEGGAEWAAWEAEFKARNWPEWPRREGMDGMYFPIGGPAGLAAFEQELAAKHTNNEAAQ